MDQVQPVKPPYGDFVLFGIVLNRSKGTPEK